MLAKKKTPTITNYTSNPVLATVKPDWKGTPLDEDGLFILWFDTTACKVEVI